MHNYKYIVVGSGFFGATVAERIATELEEKVLVLEKRNHIGGNCYSEIDPASDIECHMYGSHIFHTSIRRVWDYITKFTKFNNYRHKVLTTYDNKIYQMPINLSTINRFYDCNLKPCEVESFLSHEIGKENLSRIDSFEEKAISMVGRKLYEAFIEGYSQKQWRTSLKDLPASIINRIPLRTNYLSEYFEDEYQGIPLDGYTKLFSNMLSNRNIELMLDTDFFDVNKDINDETVVIFTGPIDKFYDYEYGRLGWRSVKFEKELYDYEDFQGSSVMNFADKHIPYTRIHEFKHFHPERLGQDKTVIFKEFSVDCKSDNEEYYPVSTYIDKQIYKKYVEKSKLTQKVYFGGRLGQYKYFDMDDSIHEALKLFDEIKLAKVKCSINAK